MNKKELVECLSEKVNCSKADAMRMVDAFSEAVFTSLKKGNDLSIAGLGSFTTSKRAARAGRNPKTGATIQIPAMTVPKFKAAKALKDSLR